MYEERARNVRRTWLLVTIFILMVGVVGYAFGFLLGAGPVGVVFAALIGIIMAWWSYKRGDRLVLRVAGARPVGPDEEPRYHNLVDGLCLAAGLPKPALYVVEEPGLNAFATGRDPAHASVAVTRGLLDNLTRVELEGVLAHELAHIRNRDTLVLAIAATLVGVLILLSDWMFRAMWWGGAGRSRGGGRGGNPAALVAVGVALLFAILAPLIGEILRFAIGRRREYLADVTGAFLTRYPPGLISALGKLRDGSTEISTASRATANLWIESPIRRRGRGMRIGLNRLFDTHPPIEDRIRVLEEM